ncbi:MAG: hypothetical protein LIO80_02845 [Lachnospiraceae bacterium]|nr:hypothetical protein [Lachnospiraceae bacterium]
MFSNAEVNRLSWLCAAQVVDDALSLFPSAFTAEGIRMRRDFVSRVREADGIGMDEVYTWTKIRQLLGS